MNTVDLKSPKELIVEAHTAMIEARRARDRSRELVAETQQLLIKARQVRTENIDLQLLCNSASLPS